MIKSLKSRDIAYYLKNRPKILASLFIAFLAVFIVLLDELSTGNLGHSQIMPANSSSKIIENNTLSDLVVEKNTTSSQDLVNDTENSNASGILSNSSLITTSTNSMNNAENTTGVNNTAIGYLAANALLLSGNNFFGGTQSGAALTNAFFNTFLGAQSGFNLLTGSRNLLLGYQSGISYTTNESNNILLANDGVIAESNTMRLGTTGAGAGQVNRAFVAGVSGVNVGATATVATVAADGQLGTANIVAGAGITVTPGANTITIAAAGGGGAYSEGVWNPILSFNGQTVAPTYLVSAASTFYVKVGNVVTVNSSIVMTNQGTSPGTARFVIGGFPFDTNGLIAYVTFYIQAFSGSVGTFISNAILSGTDTSTASIQAVKVAGVNSTVFNLTAANFPNTQGPYTIRINCTYIVGF